VFGNLLVGVLVDLSIIIVNWNTSELLQQCLNSIRESGSHLSMEIIVVDNASTDESVKVVRKEFPSVILIENQKNLGFASANNQGLSIAKGQYILLLNSDTIITVGVLDALLEVANSHPEVGVIGPQLLNMDKSVQESWSSFPSFASELLGRNFRNRTPVENVAQTFDVDWVGGACILVRVKTINEVGKLDPEYFFYSEEMDWCFRIKQKNWKVWYLAAVQIYHLGGGSSDRASLKQLVLLYRSKLLFFKKHHGWLKAMILRYGFVAVNVFGVARRFLFFNWRKKDATYQRIVDQTRLIWFLLMDRHPDVIARSQ